MVYSMSSSTRYCEKGCYSRKKSTAANRLSLTCASSKIYHHTIDRFQRRCRPISKAAWVLGSNSSWINIANKRANRRIWFLLVYGQLFHPVTSSSWLIRIIMSGTRRSSSRVGTPQCYRYFRCCFDRWLGCVLIWCNTCDAQVSSSRVGIIANVSNMPGTSPTLEKKSDKVLAYTSHPSLSRGTLILIAILSDHSEVRRLL